MRLIPHIFITCSIVLKILGSLFNNTFFFYVLQVLNQNWLDLLRRNVGQYTRVLNGLNHHILIFTIFVDFYTRQMSYNLLQSVEMRLC